MTILEAIKNFSAQLAYEPAVENSASLAATGSYLVVGMGGSNHATDLLKCWRPSIDVIVQRDYGLPEKVDNKRLVIACSYSGNTEEPIDALEAAKQRQLPVAIISTGGILAEKARQYGAPFIQLPEVGLQPRSATGYMFVALLKLMGDEKDLAEAHAFAKKFKPDDQRITGKKIAASLRKHIPVIYASARNSALANNWKIKFNENAKLPSYSQTFPELNHNEMNGFESAEKVKPLSKKIAFVILKDTEDHPRVQKRMAITEAMYKDRGFVVASVALSGQTRLERIFSCTAMADWVSVYLAKYYHIDPEPVALVEEFKKRMAE